MREFVTTKVTIIGVTLLAICIVSCQGGVKRYKDPQVLSKMKPVEKSFNNISDWIGEFYEKYQALRSVPRMPSGFQRVDLVGFNQDVGDIREELEDLEYRSEEPYATAIDAMLQAVDLAEGARDGYWNIEESMATSPIAPGTQMKIETSRSFTRCARGLIAAADAIHIPKNERPQWLNKEW